MVRFVLDMCTSIVILAWSCNELRDFVAFASFQRDVFGFGSPPAAHRSGS